MIYTGIGSREIPPETYELFKSFGEILARKNYILRSGAAHGADAAFEAGCDIVDGKKEIYLPWPNFNVNRSNLYDLKENAFSIAGYYHPTWKGLNETSKKFMARNVYQVLGYNLDTPTDFVICYTDDGSEGKTTAKTGGTGMAIRLAYSLDIPIYNVKNQGSLMCLLDLLEEL